MVTSLCKGACREREATSVIRNRRQTCSRSPPNPRSAHMRSCPLPDHRSHGQPVTGSARRRQTRAIRVPVQRRRPAVGQRSAATSPATSAEQVPGVLPCQQIPAVPVTGSGRRHRARQSTSGHPGATGHDRDRHQPADSFPAAPGHRLQARLARGHRPALAVDVGAAKCPDLGGSNHGTEGSGWAPDRRLWIGSDSVRMTNPTGHPAP